MASRYGDQNYNRYGRRSGEFDRSRSGGRSERERFGGSRFGSDRFEDDREERYFGSGRQQFGGGYSGSSHDLATGWRDTEFEDRSPNYGYDRPERDFSRGRMRDSSYGNPSYRDESRRHTEDYARGGPRYSREQYGPYPESESGYRTESDQERGWLDKASDEVSAWFGDEEAERRRRMDAREGPYRGRGPRNYNRSDDRIKEDVNDRLTDHAYIDASEIEVSVSGGDVVLTGTVESRYDKRMAEDLAEDVSGVKNVENRLRVESQWKQEPGNWAYSDTAGHAETGRSTTAGSSANTGTTPSTGKSKGASGSR